MATLTATSWSVRNPESTGTTEDFDFTNVTIEGKKKHAYLKCILTTSGSVPTAGIPLPTFGRVGMVRNVDYYILLHPTTLATANLAMSVSGVSLSIASGGLAVIFHTTTATSAPAVLDTGATIGSGLSLILTAVGW